MRVSYFEPTTDFKESFAKFCSIRGYVNVQFPTTNKNKAKYRNGEVEVVLVALNALK